jgi:hypothetical protein
MYNNTVLQFGGNVLGTALYDVALNKWVAGPVPPNSLDQADGPAALEPNGKVLALLSPGLFQTGCQFVEYDPTTNAFTLPPNPEQCPNSSSYEGRLMVLPTGQIMFTSKHRGFGNVASIYTPAPGVIAKAKPIVVSAGNSIISPSKNNVIYGYGFNGLTQNNAYGDDYQTDTNYPLVVFRESGNR